MRDKGPQVVIIRLKPVAKILEQTSGLDVLP